ncbi:MAG: diacylglycerol kinase [Clostridiales bacterium]|nr:diacylglycerol kinase [Clostridiales bacterium]
MRIRKMIDSFNYAVEGIIYSVKSQKNMRIHYGIATLVLLIALFFDLTRYEVMILFLTVSLVIITEMFNTAIEKTIDLITSEYHELAKIAKNVAAGAVLISSLNAIIVSYFLFFRKINPYSLRVLEHVEQVPAHISFIALIIVIIITIIGKAYFAKGTPFRGGMPSGHAAVSFSLVTSIAFVSRDAFVTTMAVLMALLVSQSRIESKTHSLFEIVVGATVGVLLTIVLFRIFN